MIAFIKTLFKKEPAEPIIPDILPVCFICGKGENSQKLESFYNGSDILLYHITNSLSYHKKCVEDLICNADDVTIETMSYKLRRAIKLVAHWKEVEEEQEKQNRELRDQLIDIKEYFCNKENN